MEKNIKRSNIEGGYEQPSAGIFDERNVITAIACIEAVQKNSTTHTRAIPPFIASTVNKGHRASLLRLFSYMFILVFCAACARQTFTSGVEVPNGVVIPHGATPGLYRGLYIESGDSAGCCWIAPHTQLTLRKTRYAGSLVLVFFVPDNEGLLKNWFTSHPLRVTAHFGKKTESNCCYGPGMQSTKFRLPPSLARKTTDVDIAIQVKPGFVPHDIDPANGDIRKLGFILNRVFWR